MKKKVSMISNYKDNSSVLENITNRSSNFDVAIGQSIIIDINSFRSLFEEEEENEIVEDKDKERYLSKIKTIEENNAHYILSNKLNQINLEIQNNCLDYKEYLMNHLSKIHGNLFNHSKDVISPISNSTHDKLLKNIVSPKAVINELEKQKKNKVNK